MLFQSYQKAAIAREILLADLNDDDKKLVAHILYPVQEKHAMLSVENKRKTIEEIHLVIFAKAKSK